MNRPTSTLATLQRMLRLLAPVALLFSTYASAGTLPDTVEGSTNSAVTINGSRNFDITGITEIRLDGEALSPSQLMTIGAGFNALVRAENVDPLLSQGTAVQIDLRNLVRGPVTGIDPLSVLNQPLVANGDTVLVDVPEGDLSNIGVNDLLDVSGYLDPNGTIVAARIRYRTDTTTDWKLSGYVSGLSGNVFAIGAQTVDFTGAVPVNCGAALQDGHFVEVEMLPNAGYTPGSTLSDVIQLSCEDPNFSNPPPGQSLVSLEGIIQSLPDPLPTPPTFTLLDLQIVTTPQTQYRRGSIDDLDVGVRVEVEGFYDSSSQTVTAREVHFKQAQLRFEAPVGPDDVTPNESVAIMGNTIVFNAQTRDEDGIAAGGISSPMQIEVRGLMDNDGNMFATRIRERGDPDLSDTELRGPVTVIDRPNLVILGIDVDGSSAVFRDQNNQPITADQFFALVRIGTIVSAEDATYDPASGLLIAGKLEIEDDVVLPNSVSEGLGVNALSRGTITGFGDSIFGNGFE